MKNFTPSPTKKNRLCMILGGPNDLLKLRIDASFKECDPDLYDYLFTGYPCEYKLFTEYTKREYPNIWEQIRGTVAYVESFNTWSNLEQSRPYWKQYKTILLFTEKIHGKRVKRFFDLLGRKKGVYIFETAGKESLFANFFYLFETTPQKIRLMTKIAFLLRRRKLS